MAEGEIGADLTDKNPPGGNTADPQSTKDGKKASTHKSDAATWKERFRIASDNQTPMFRRWADWYKALYAIKTYKNIGAWRSKVFVPIMSYKIWSIVAKMLALRPGFSVKIYDKLYSQADAEKIQKANLMLDYDYDNPMLDESVRDRMFDSVSDAVVVGTGFGLANWCTEDRRNYSEFQKEDGTVDYTKANVTTEPFGYNDLDPVNPFDVFAAPGRRSFEAKPWIIIKCPSTTRAELLQDSNYDESAVRALLPIGDRQDKLANLKQSRDNLLGKRSQDQNSLDDTVDAFDVYKCYEKCEDGVYLTVFAEALKSKSGTDNKQGTGDKDTQWSQLFDSRQPSWHDKYPLVPYYIRRKPHQAWGESIFEVTESMANAYNDIINQYMDNLNIVGNGGVLMHSTETQIYDFYYAPGGEIRYSGTKPEFETPTSPDLAIFDHMMAVLEKGIEWGSISNYASGNPSDSTDKTQGTAAGIQSLQEAAGEIVTFMKSNFMQTLKAVGNRWLSNNRQFREDPLALTKTVNGQDKVYTINKNDFTDKMVCTIDEDSMQPMTPDQRIKMLTGWITQTFALQTQSFIQAGIAPAAKGMQPLPPPTDAQGQPTIKPMYLDIEAIGAEVSNEYGRPDFQDFIKSDQTSPDQIPVLSDMIDKIREMESDGEIDTVKAQELINQLEATDVATQQPQPTPAEPVMAGGPGIPTDPAQQPA